MEVSVQQELTKGGWRSCICIIGVEFTERFAFYGMAGNLITYLTNELGESIVMAAKNVNAWFGVAALLPLLGAFVADSYLGRFNTILFASIIYVMGLVMLTVTVSVIPMRFRYFMFFLSIYMATVGAGGHRPCVQTFGADQFDDDKPEDKKAKSTFFNWWYFGVCGGSSAAMLILFYIQENVGWAMGFGIPAVAMAVALLVFLLGRKSYKRVIPRGSPLTRVLQVFVAACRKRHLTVSMDGHGQYCCEEAEVGEDMNVQPWSQNLTQTHHFKFLNKASMIDDLDSLSTTKNKWRLCSMNQVEEVKLLLRLIPIWLTSLMYGTVFSQINTFFTKQGSTMNTKITSHFHVPPASLQVSICLVVIVAVPIYDRVIIPIARKITGYPSGITMLQRIGIGIILSVFAMVAAALVEARRVTIAREHALMDQPHSTVPMTIWWLLPQYVIVGVSEVFGVIGLQELFYDQMPYEMRSMGAAAYLSVFGIGSFISTGIISVIQWISERGGDKWLGNNLNRAHLDYYYWVLAGLITLSLCGYLAVAKSFVYKKISSNAML